MVMVNHDADDDTIGVSINAGTIDTTAYSSGVYDGTQPFTLGAGAAGALGLDGRQDITIRYDRILTQSEIEWLYNSGQGRAYADVNPDSLKDDLVSWWSLDETIGTRDDSHGSNNLVDHNTVGYTTGKQGNASAFTAANSEYLDIADNADLSLNGTDFTVAGWVNLSSKSNYRDIIVKGYTTSSNREYALIYDHTIDRFGFYVSPNGTTSYNVNANTFGSPSTGTWYFVVAWYDGSNLYISVNNGVADSITYSSGVYDGTQPFGLGYNYYHDGSMDEVAVYKRVLTAEERSWLYNAGSGRSYHEMEPEPPSTEGWFEAEYAVRCRPAPRREFGNARYEHRHLRLRRTTAI